MCLKLKTSVDTWVLFLVVCFFMLHEARTTLCARSDRRDRRVEYWNQITTEDMADPDMMLSREKLCEEPHTHTARLYGQVYTLACSLSSRHAWSPHHSVVLNAFVNPDTAVGNTRTEMWAQAPRVPWKVSPSEGIWVSNGRHNYKCTVISLPRNATQDMRLRNDLRFTPRQHPLSCECASCGSCWKSKG